MGKSKASSFSRCVGERDSMQKRQYAKEKFDLLDSWDQKLDGALASEEENTKYEY